MKIQQNIPLAPYTTLKIGGPADYFVIAKSQTDLIDALLWAQEKKLPYFILGQGSNVLISDSGFRGLVIKLLITCPLRVAKQGGGANYQLLNNILTAEAGASMPTLAKLTAKAGLTGLEFGIGIPGSVGGAIWGNAGAFGQEIKDTLKSVQILMTENNFKKYFSKQNNCYIVKLPARLPRLRGQVELRAGPPKLRAGPPKLRAGPPKLRAGRIGGLNCCQDKYIIAKIDDSACLFAYRDSIFKKHKNWIILSAEFKLKKDIIDKCQKRLKEYLQNKIANQPIGEKSIGSIFKNIFIPHQTELQNILKKLKIVNCKLKIDHSIPAWRLIDQVGLRGFKVGGAQISKKHANFIINTGNAKAEDFIILISLIKQKVRNKFGIQLKEEIKLVGFTD